MWTYINEAKCSVCKQFVNYKTIDEVDGFIDVAKRHYPDGLRVSLGTREGYHQ